MTMTSDQVLQLLYDAGVKDHAGLTSWLATAKAESTLNPSVVNSIGATGLFQINQPVWVKEHPTWSKAWLQDPGNNVAAAKIVSNGWKNHGPWVSSALMQAANTPKCSLEATAFLQSPAEKAVEGAIDTAAPVINAATAVPDFLHALSQPGTWLRVAYAVVGVGLLVVGLNQLSGGTIQQTAIRARKVVPL
jgi:hypothetical protein